MKKLLITLGLLAATFSAFSQDGGSAMNKAVSRATRSRDFLVVSFSYDAWAGKPDSVKTGFNRGFNIALMYDFPIKQSHFSLAAGLGISTSGIFLQDHRLNMADGTTNRPQFIKDGSPRKYKVATTYLELPIEFRFRSVPDNANKGFKAAIGAKVGNLLNAHTKWKSTLGGEKNIVKEQNKRFFNTWRFAATARVGYGNFALFGTYNFNPLFKDEGAYDIRPYSIGIAISGL